METHNHTGYLKYVSSPYRCDPKKKKKKVVAKVENGFSAVTETFLMDDSANQISRHSISVWD